MAEEAKKVKQAKGTLNVNAVQNDLPDAKEPPESRFNVTNVNAVQNDLKQEPEKTEEPAAKEG